MPINNYGFSINLLNSARSTNDSATSPVSRTKETDVIQRWGEFA